MGWPSIHMWRLRMRRDILVAEVPREERGVPAPHPASQPRAPVVGRGIGTTAGIETQRYSVQSW